MISIFYVEVDPCLEMECINPIKDKNTSCILNEQNQTECICPSGFGGNKCQYRKKSNTIISFKEKLCSLPYLISQVKLFVDYVLRQSNWCYPTIKEEKYSNMFNIEDAIKSCNDQEDCMMFYDINSEEAKYSLCDRGSSIRASSNFSSLYLKCEKPKMLIDNRNFYLC